MERRLSAAAAPGEASSETVIINVSGFKFETTLKTLLSVRGSRLETLAKCRKDHASYRHAQGDYYFDRHPGAFESVLQFHRTGVLHANVGVCGSLMKQELKYWGVDDALVEQCCWDAFSQSVERSADFEKMESHFNGDYVFDVRPRHDMNAWRRRALKLWLVLNTPSYSTAAKAVLLLSTILTIVSIAIVIAESHCDAIPSQNSTGASNSSVSTDRMCDFSAILQRVDLGVYAYFIAEFLLRIATAPEKRKFIFTALSAVDIVCIFGQTATIATTYSPAVLAVGSAAAALHDGFRWLRMLQLLRVFKLLRHSVMAKVLMYTVLMSLHELAIVIVFLSSFVAFFACLAHYVEADTFPSISYACWWALITLTTVGYGDVVPKTTAGYVVGAVCALWGIFVLAFTVPVVVSNFNLYYNHVRTRRRWRDKCKRARFTSSIWKELPFLGRRLESWPGHVNKVSE